MMSSGEWRRGRRRPSRIVMQLMTLFSYGWLDGYINGVCLMKQVYY